MLNLVAPPATKSSLARCVRNPPRAAAYAYGEIGNWGWKYERTYDNDRLGQFPHAVRQVC
jgi:hypothetical protein